MPGFDNELTVNIQGVLLLSTLIRGRTYKCKKCTGENEGNFLYADFRTRCRVIAATIRTGDA